MPVRRAKPPERGRCDACPHRDRLGKRSNPSRPRRVVRRTVVGGCGRCANAQAGARKASSNALRKAGRAARMKRSRSSRPGKAGGGEYLRRQSPHPLGTAPIALCVRGIRDAPAVVDVEEAMLQWAKDEPRRLAEVALLAYWPEDRNASDSAAIKQTLACLRAISAGGTPTLGGFAVAQINAFASDGRWMQTLRANPVSRTRAAERTHPRRNENWPAELAMRDPGAARSLRPPRLQAPAHAAAEAAAHRVPMPSSRTPPRATHRANPNADATTDPPVTPSSALCSFSWQGVRMETSAAQSGGCDDMLSTVRTDETGVR